MVAPNLFRVFNPYILAVAFLVFVQASAVFDCLHSDIVIRNVDGHVILPAYKCGIEVTYSDLLDEPEISLLRPHLNQSDKFALVFLSKHHRHDNISSVHWFLKNLTIFHGSLTANRTQQNIVQNYVSPMNQMANYTVAVYRHLHTSPLPHIRSDIADIDAWEDSLRGVIEPIAKTTFKVRFEPSPYPHQQLSGSSAPHLQHIPTHTPIVTESTHIQQISHAQPPIINQATSQHHPHNLNQNIPAAVNNSQNKPVVFKNINQMGPMYNSELAVSSNTTRNHEISNSTTVPSATPVSKGSGMTFMPECQIIIMGVIFASFLFS